LFLITGDLHEAEDVVQEAFARAAVRWVRLSDDDAPETWVRRVAINLASDGFRRGRRLLAMARLGPRPLVPPVSVESRALADALATLPRSQREAIVLHHLLDLPVDEVARQTGTALGTVKSRLARSRQALALALGDDQEEVAVANG
jgi:RNA polymerase sigma-70 factor (ECF subfamily)